MPPDENEPKPGSSGTIPASESMVIDAVDDQAVPRDSEPALEASESMVIDAVDDSEPKPADSAELLAIEATAQKRHETDATWPKPRELLEDLIDDAQKKGPP